MVHLKLMHGRLLTLHTHAKVDPCMNQTAHHPLPRQAGATP